MPATTYYLSPISMIVQFLTNVGIVAAGGAITLYNAGTSALATTYTDSTGTVANPNPMTLNAAGRPASASGAPVGFWVAGGTMLKLVVTDVTGAVLVGPLDQIPSINDTTAQSSALQALLASPASANVSGAGAVAGADLVANAVKSYDVFADVRAANAPVLASGQTLNMITQGAIAVGDSLGGLFYWAAGSSAADDGKNVLKPTATSSASPGRWLRFFPLGVPQIVVKTADQPVAANTALVSDSQLVCTLTPGTWLVSVRANLLGVGGTGQGYKIAVASSATYTGPTNGVGVNSANGTAAVAALNIGGTSVQAAAISSTVGDTANFDFALLVATAGTFTVQFCQNSSSANVTTMKAGSLLIATRVA